MNDSATTIMPELIAKLRERYTPPTIPPCRVCGGKLSIAQVGGGQPTEWACSGKEDDPERPGWLRDAPGRWTNAPDGGSSELRADGHYNRSRWTDYRQGGDSDVIAVLDALEAALAQQHAPSAPVWDLSCCGGNDETPKSHCMDCPRYPGVPAERPERCQHGVRNPHPCRKCEDGPSAPVGVEAGWYRYNKPAPRWEDTKFGKWLDPAVYGPPREQHGYSLEVAGIAHPPPSEPVGVEGLRRCGRCKREGDSPDCTRCGGTGWRRKCDDLDCAEHGCCGGQTCYVAPEEVPALARQPAAPVGVEEPLSLLRAGHWREVYVGHRCMRLEVTYEHAAWERLMEQVEAALAQQPAAGILDRIRQTSEYALEKKRLEGYQQGYQHGLSEQPAAVDEAMVERAAKAWCAGTSTPFDQLPGPGKERCLADMRIALEAALAQQPAAVAPVGVEWLAQGVAEWVIASLGDLTDDYANMSTRDVVLALLDNREHAPALTQHPAAEMNEPFGKVCE